MHVEQTVSGAEGGRAQTDAAHALLQPGGEPHAHDSSAFRSTADIGQAFVGVMPEAMSVMASAQWRQPPPAPPAPPVLAVELVVFLPPLPSAPPVLAVVELVPAVPP
jgi:hypothetical protein